MSMREYPSSGYVISLDDLTKILPEALQDRYEELLDELDDGDVDEEAIAAFLTENLSEKFPAFNIYRPSDEDTVDEPMEQGKYYAIFDEDDLYEKKPTPEHEAMLKLGIKPEFARWSVWG